MTNRVPIVVHKRRPPSVAHHELPAIEGRTEKGADMATLRDPHDWNQ